MPIRQFLDGLDPWTKGVVAVAFEMVCIALRLTDRGALINEIVANER